MRSHRDLVHWEHAQKRRAARQLRGSPRSPESSLLVLLAIEGATIPWIRPLLSVHIFVGMLLLGPVALKLATTGYRFARYYTGGPDTSARARRAR